jgi:chaperone required for assembly of F1-ATPase
MTIQAAQNIILANWDSVTFIKIAPAQSIIPTAMPTTAVVNNAIDTPTNAIVNQNSATALCNDGTYSYAAHHQGACSKHGGVKEFYK